MGTSSGEEEAASNRKGREWLEAEEAHREGSGAAEGGRDEPGGHSPLYHISLPTQQRDPRRYY